MMSHKKQRAHSLFQYNKWVRVRSPGLSIQDYLEKQSRSSTEYRKITIFIIEYYNTTEKVTKTHLLTTDRYIVMVCCVALKTAALMLENVTSKHKAKLGLM